jgi:hypothetical protein
MIDPSKSGYKDPAFLKFCAAFQEFRWPKSWSTLRTSTRAAGVIARTSGSLLRQQTYKFGVSNTTTGQMIYARFEGNHFGMTLARFSVATLLLPLTFEIYMKGKSRQALRTNVRKANTEGITCIKTQESHIIHEVGKILTIGWNPSWEKMLRYPDFGEKLPHADAYIAYNSVMKPIALSLLLVDDEVAYLYWSHATRAPDEMVCRYSLHATIIEDLIARGVRSYVVDNVIRLEPGLQYFQARLGFAPAHLKFRSVKS